MEDLIINRRVKQLREQIAQQKELLLDLIEQWYYLRYIVQPRLQFEYEKIFGDLENELEEKATICNSMERKLELFFVKISRGMRITRKMWDFVEKSVDVPNSKSTNNRTPINNYSKVVTNDSGENLHKELNKMYKALVKQLHPDVSGESEFFRKFWVPIQDAYKEKNYSKIRVFYKVLNEEFNNFEIEEDTVRKLEEELKELRLMVSIEKRVLERMQLQEPFIYEKNLKNPHWIEQHRKKLKEKISFLDKQIDFNRRLLEKIEENLED
ncbi:MAG: hypothetical protein ACPLPX_03980 [Candidatus Kapaibacteriota bacterium]